MTAAGHFLVLTALLLSEKLSALKLEVEEISLTSASQRRKLGIVLEATNRSLQVEEQEAQWSVESTWGRARLVPGRGGGTVCTGFSLDNQHTHPPKNHHRGLEGHRGLRQPIARAQALDTKSGVWWERN